MTQAAVKHTIEDCPQNTPIKVMATKIDALVNYAEDTREFHKEMISSMRLLAENSAHVSNLIEKQGKTEKDVDALAERQRNTELTVKEHDDYIENHQEETKNERETIRQFKVGLAVALISAGLIAGVTLAIFLIDKFDYTQPVKKVMTTEIKSGQGR